MWTSAAHIMGVLPAGRNPGGFDIFLIPTASGGVPVVGQEDNISIKEAKPIDFRGKGMDGMGMGEIWVRFSDTKRGPIFDVFSLKRLRSLRLRESFCVNSGANWRAQRPIGF
ncbi:hypothetical protein TRIP_C21045 [Candidatus Zixiibacteriota bacterium]|nr:hypothetical protein TRIP_C21045 [candidate division Zixibacteria bacterium]